MVYVIQVCWQLANRIRMELVPSWSCSQAVSKPVWHISLLCVQWITPDDRQRNCLKHAEFYSTNKFEKLVHLIGFIIRIYHNAQSPECQIHKSVDFLNCVVMFSTPWVVAETRELQIIRKVIKPPLAWIFLYNQETWDCVYDWFCPVLASAVLFQGKLVFLKCHITSKVTQLLRRASNLTLLGGQNLLLLYLSIQHIACCMKLSCDLFYLTL